MNNQQRKMQYLAKYAGGRAAEGLAAARLLRRARVIVRSEHEGCYWLRNDRGACLASAIWDASDRHGDWDGYDRVRDVCRPLDDARADLAAVLRVLDRAIANLEAGRA